MSHWQKQLLHTLQSPPLVRLERQLWSKLRSRQFRLLCLWAAGSVGFLFLLLWDWKLVLATSLGIGAMWSVYLLQGWDWQRLESRWRHFLQSRERRFIIAVGSGGLATFSTYLAASIWLHVENRWVATGLIFQGAGILLTLLVLAWRLLVRPSEQAEVQFDRLVLQLNDVDPLRRLILVRQLTKLVQKLGREQTQQLCDYFQVMLTQEEDSRVRESLLMSLQSLMSRPKEQTSPQPLKMPLHLQSPMTPSIHPRHRHRQ
ncbi:MAG: ATP synthase subunit I [Kamptonema sp. SIO4C4]|nr:ATP synthase subunit I [Kamptonema sp. SIO4C4]